MILSEKEGWDTLGLWVNKLLPEEKSFCFGATAWNAEVERLEVNVELVGDDEVAAKAEFEADSRVEDVW